MIKAIIWKEWKSWRWVFAAFLLAATVIPAIPAQLFSSDATAQYFIYSIWFLYCLFAGLLFYQQKRAGIPFLSARPSTKPLVFSIHYLSYLSMLAVLIIVSLLVHYTHMTIKTAGQFSALDMILSPELLNGVTLYFLVFSLSLFMAASALVIGLRNVGIGLASIVVLLFIFRNQISALTRPLPSLRSTESPIIYLCLLLSGIILLGALNLLEISFDELRDARNRRWTRAVITASIMAAAMIVVTAIMIIQSTPRPSDTKFKQIIVTDDPLKIIGVMSKGSGEDFLAGVDEDPGTPGQRTFLLQNLKVNGRLFAYVRGRNERKLIYFSDKATMGQEIRALDINNSEVEIISRAHHWRKQTISSPFLSPDGDRVAYLKTSPQVDGINGDSPQKTGQSPFIQSLWITKFSFGYLADSVELPASDSASFEPIGWTPDGYDFMLRKNGAVGPEIWAVDWVATGARRFLPEFSTATITEDDLPPAGEWISLLQKDAGGKWALWLVNYRSGEKKQIGLFRNASMDKWGQSTKNGTVPIYLRAWSKSGNRFAWSSPEDGLHIYNIPDATQQPVICASSPVIEQMKWSPRDTKLAIVANEPDASGKKPCLALIDPANCSVKRLAENFSANKQQWEWYSENIIVYAVGSELRQVDTAGKTTLITSTSTLSKTD